MTETTTNNSTTNNENLAKKRKQPDTEKLSDLPESKLEKISKLDSKGIKELAIEVTIPKISKEEEETLLNMKKEDKLSKMKENKPMTLFEALCEVVTMADVTKEHLIKMAKLSPEKVKEDLVSFCNDVANENLRIKKGLQEEEEEINKTDEKENNTNEDGDKDENEKTEGDQPEAEKEEVIVIYSKIEDIEKDLDDVDVIQEALIDSLSEHASEKMFSIEEILAFTEAGALVDELWKRVNWVGQYRLEQDELTAL